MDYNTKTVPFSDLKAGMTIEGYKKDTCITFCMRKVKSIGNNTVTFSKLFSDITESDCESTLENASDYSFIVKLTTDELKEKYKEEIEDIKKALSHKLSQVDGYHEMWNTWLYVGSLEEIAAELRKNEMKIIGYATLSTPKYSLTGVYDIGVVAEYDNGERIWCHATDEYRKMLLTDFGINNED